jgi:hypothetical protein
MSIAAKLGDNTEKSERTKAVESDKPRFRQLLQFLNFNPIAKP